MGFRAALRTTAAAFIFLVATAAATPITAWCASGRLATARDVDARCYEDGPLSHHDCRATIPEQSEGLDAFTTTELLFNYQYRTRPSGRRTIAWTTDIWVAAVVNPSASWNAKPEDASLLDHEQGHFDLTQIAVLRARLQFARNSRVSCVAGDPELALANLRARVYLQLQPFLEGVLAEHDAYDWTTGHGRNAAVQREHRQRHRQELDALTRQLAGRESVGGRVTSSRPASRSLP